MKEISNHKKYLLILLLLCIAVLSVQCVTRPTSDKSNESGKSKSAPSTNNVFTSRTAGFSITKPDSWHFVTAEEHLRHMEKAKEETNDEHQRKMIDLAIKSGVAIPLVAMSKYKEPYDDLNPLLIVRIRPSPNELQSTQILNAMLPSLQTALTDFKIQVQPEEVHVSGLEGAYMRAQYKEDIKGIGSILLIGEFWIVPKGSHFFMINANTRVDEKTGSRKEIKSIIETIKFE